MIISFDMDDTLISHSAEFDVERPTWLSKLIRGEKIRKGTIHLFKTLQADGHQVWIYTTSYRSIFYMRNLFLSYGLYPQRFINEKRNRRKLDRAQCNASKNAALFGIDIHIDDSLGVGEEGDRYGYRTIIISPTDKDWVKKILMRIAIFSAM